MTKTWNAIVVRFVGISAMSLIIGIISSRFSYESYWKETIRRVQTVDFNILAHSLPTKLSHTILKNDTELIQNTLDSNYGLFGLVITDCQTSEKFCPKQQIKYATNSKLKWRNNLSLQVLENSPYSTLQDPPPLKPEFYFESPSSEIWKTTQQQSQGKIIGRVYYIRGSHPSFQEDLLGWFSRLPQSLWNVRGADKYYTLTLVLFIFVGILVWLVLEFILYRKRIKEAKIEQERLSLENSLNDYLQQIKKLKLEKEQLLNEQEKNYDEYHLATEFLESQVSYLAEQLEIEKNIKSDLKLELDTLIIARDTAREELKNLEENQVQSYQSKINLLNEDIAQKERQILSSSNKLESLKQNLKDSKERENRAASEINLLKQSLEQLELRYKESQQLSSEQIKNEEFKNFYIDSLEEENKQLKDENKQLKNNNNKLELDYLRNLDELESLQSNKEETIRQYAYQLGTLSKLYRELKQQVSNSVEVETFAEDFRSLEEVLLKVEEKFSDALVIWNDAKNSSKSFQTSSSRGFAKIYQAFLILASVAREYFEFHNLGITIGYSLEQLFKNQGVNYYRANESQATMNRFGHQRTFYDGHGQKLVMEKHLSLSFNQDVWVHIYFEINHDLQKFDVGYCGKHLNYDTQNT